ncbi:MAG: hypothetical protein FJ308_24290 [Planctomycetes bacterium]|nr:hypothetical protein [Planctomycetota bacterium]
MIQQRITPELKAGNFDKGILSGTEGLVQLLEGKTLEQVDDSGSFEFTPLEPALAIPITAFLVALAVWIRLSFPESSNKLLGNLQGLAGLVVVRGLGQSVKLHPHQSSRVKEWHLLVEQGRSMRCASCGALLEAIDQETVDRSLQPRQKAAQSLGSLHFKAWKCRRCAPDAMHLPIYESTSKQFDRCPNCQELTIKKT